MQYYLVVSSIPLMVGCGFHTRLTSSMKSVSLLSTVTFMKSKSHTPYLVLLAFSLFKILSGLHLLVPW